MGNQIQTRASIVIPSNQLPRKYVLGIIDVQNDFCEGGALAVKEADRVVGPINKLRYIFDDHIQVFITQDWHNPDHMSFAETHGEKPYTKKTLCLPMEDGTAVETIQVLWPTHCVKHSNGAMLHPDLIVTTKDTIIRKGTVTNVESYSAFGDENKNKYERTHLNSWLTEYGVTDIILTGIATDYCIYNTALDAIRLGFTVHLILSCTRGVAEDTTNTAFIDMKSKGVFMYESVEKFCIINKRHIIL